jgi:ABC-type glycerol-3-phosphate transport system substrate-binding protein
LSFAAVFVMLFGFTAVFAPSAASTPRAQGDRDQIILSVLDAPTDFAAHPWYDLIEEYNASHPDVEVIALTGLGWDALATMILAGNPPDLMHVAMSGIFELVPQMPGAVDVSPWLTDEDIADFGPLFDTLRHPANPDHILGFPVELRPEPEMCANVALFEQAGIDWMKIRSQGWTWDEFIAAAQLLTVDENGKHPNEEGFDADNVATWGTGSLKDGLAWTLGIAMMNNGVAQYTGITMANVGSVWDLASPQAAEAAQWIQDWMYKYQITDPAFRAWGDPQFVQMFQYLIEGKTAMHAWGGTSCLGGVDLYNQAVERGEIAGTPLEAQLWPLPHPYNPANMPHEVYSVQPIYLQMMRQEPYKGDEHTENVAEFAKWFISTETQIRLCTEISEVPCPTPARQSVRQAVITDPQRQADIDYMVARIKTSPQFAHPVLPTIQRQLWNPAVDRLFANDVTGQEFVDEIAAGAQPMLDDWVTERTPEDAAMVELWCKVPSGFPGTFYPNYTPTVSAACQAKLQELGIQ